MELDELKSTWNTGNGMVQEQHLTHKIIDQMTKRKYKSKINKIAFPEIIGMVICLTAAVYVVINFYKFDSPFMQGVGILSVLLLLALSAISFLSLKPLMVKENLNKPYAEALKIFSLKKIRFYKLQKVNVILSYLLLVTIIILLSKLFAGKDIADNKYFWTFSFTIGYVFLLLFSTFVSRYYKRTLKQTEELLHELQP